MFNKLDESHCLPSKWRSEQQSPFAGSVESVRDVCIPTVVLGCRSPSGHVGISPLGGIRISHTHTNAERTHASPTWWTTVQGSVELMNPDPLSLNPGPYTLDQVEWKDAGVRGVTLSMSMKNSLCRLAYHSANHGFSISSLK